MTPENPWKTVSDDDQFKRTKFAIDSYDEKHVVIAGGWDFRGEKLLSAVVLNTETGASKALPDLPPEYDGCTGAYLKGYFYMVGRKDTIFRINLSICNKWEKMSADTFAFGHGHALISNGKHLFWPGGVLNCRTYNLYEPDTNRWTLLPQMRTPRYGHATALVDNKIYVIGGAEDRSGMELSSVEVFDISSRTWSAAPRLPKALYGPAAASIGKFVIVTGGIDSDPQETSYCLIYDTHSQEWIQSKVPLSTLRYGHGCVAIQGSQVVLVGGSKTNQRGNPIVTINRKDLIPNWYVVKEFVLLRRLLDEGRAQVTLRNKDHQYDPVSAIIQKLFIYLDIDTFRAVVSFL